MTILPDNRCGECGGYGSFDDVGAKRICTRCGGTGQKMDWTSRGPMLPPLQIANPQHKTIEELRAKIAELEARIAALEARDCEWCGMPERDSE